MVCCGFLFDLVMVRVDVPYAQFENHNLFYATANFNRNILKISPSRINVVEFKKRRSFDFELPPQRLREELADNPLKITIYYDTQAIGFAKIPWDKEFLNKIDRNMGEVTNIDSSELFCCEGSQERVGVLEFIYRLQCKCEESSDDCEVLPRCDLQCEPKKLCINKAINPEDVLFLIAEPDEQNDCDACSVMDYCPACDKSHEDLDLTPYRAYNGKTINDSEVVNTCFNADCCELRRTADPCKCLYDITPDSCRGKCLMPTTCRTCPQNGPSYSYCKPPCLNRQCCSQYRSPSPCKKTKSCMACCYPTLPSWDACDINNFLKPSSSVCGGAPASFSAPCTGSNGPSCNPCDIDNFLKPEPYTICNREANLSCNKCGRATTSFQAQYMGWNSQPQSAVKDASKWFSLCRKPRAYQNCNNRVYNKCAPKRQTACEICNARAQFGYNKCPQNKQTNRTFCNVRTADPWKGFYEKKEFPNKYSLKNDNIFLLCDHESRCHNKNGTAKAKDSTTGFDRKKPISEKLLSMASECFNVANTRGEAKFDLSFACQSQTKLNKTPKKKQNNKHRFNDSLILDYKHDIRNQTKMILETCNGLLSKPVTSSPKQAPKRSTNFKSAPVPDLSVDAIMKEFLKDQ